jgi:hypothetical protein
VEAAEPAAEGGAGSDAEPARADERGADEGGGEGEAEQDLPQQVVVVEHPRGDRVAFWKKRDALSKQTSHHYR